MPKNMIVRLGVDASDFKKKMAQAGVDAENAGKKIKKSMTMSELGSEVRSIMGWGNSSSGIMGSINVGNFDAAKSQLSILKSYRDQLADAGFDDYQFGLVSERIKVLEYELNAYEETLRRTADAEREAAGAADNLGNQSQKASIPVSKASRELREMSSSGRKLSIIPGFLRRVGDSADSSNNKLEKMVRSIRNISIVSFGLRLVRGLFGELGTIIRQHVAQDAALQAQVDTLKASFGQSLAPAINIATNELSAMMPYIIGVSNAISTLISALAGPGWTTVSSGANAAAKAIGGAGGAQEKFNRSLQGFDEITKLDSKSSGGGGGGGSTTAATPMEGKLPEWMTGIVDQLSAAISRGDWAKVGNVLAKGFSDMVSNIDWAGAFSKVGSFLGGVGAVIWGAVSDSLEKHWDWLGRKTEEFGGNIWMGIGAGIGSAIRGIGSWLKENFLNPMVEGFKSTFKIHSPSTHPEITGIGKNIMLGILNGILEPWKDPVGWIKENIFNPLVSAFSGSGGSPKASIDVQANLTQWKDKLKNKAVNFQSNLTTWKDGLKNKAVNFQANLSTWKDKLQNKVVDFQSRLTSWRDNLPNKVVDFQSRLTSWRDNLPNKVVDFQSRLTTWKDSLNDKTLTFSADVVKGWSGSIASKLGIENITSRLNMILPKISIDWGSVKALGKTYNYPKGFSISWNAKGAILDGAQLFGMAGSTLLGGGEAGREAVLPLDRNTWWMDDIADRVVNRIGVPTASTDRPIQVNLVVDGKVLANTVVRNVNAQARATGKNPLAAYI